MKPDKIDNVMIFDRELTPAEVEALHNFGLEHNKISRIIRNSIFNIMTPEDELDLLIDMHIDEPYCPECTHYMQMDGDNPATLMFFGGKRYLTHKNCVKDFQLRLLMEG